MSNPIVKHRLEAFNNQSGYCYYCKCPIWLNDIKGFALNHALSLSAAARFQCTAEHLTARCDGGSNSKSNIVAACVFCNHTRHSRKNPPAPSEFKADIRKRLKKGKWHPKELQHFVSRSA